MQLMSSVRIGHKVQQLLDIEHAHVDDPDAIVGVEDQIIGEEDDVGGEDGQRREQDALPDHAARGLDAPAGGRAFLRAADAAGNQENDQQCETDDESPGGQLVGVGLTEPFAVCEGNKGFFSDQLVGDRNDQQGGQNGVDGIGDPVFGLLAAV